MPADTPQEQIVKYLADVHSMEANAIDQLHAGIKSVEDTKLKAALENHLTETEEQERLVRARLEALGASPSTLKDLAQRGWAAVVGLAENFSPDTDGKIAITSFMFEHLEIASYRSLRAVAEATGDDETAALAAKIVEQEQGAADNLSALLEAVAVASVPQAV
jgi:ferritin-like metal-binding protein YciE